MGIVVALATVLVLAGCGTYPSGPAQSTAQPAPGTIRPFIGQTMVVGARVGSGLK